MKTFLVVALVLLAIQIATSERLCGETNQFRQWTFNNGESIKLKLENAYGRHAYFTEKRRRPVSAEIIAFIESDQAEIVYWSRQRDRVVTQEALEPSEFTQRFRKDAKKLENGTLVDADWSSATEPEFYGIYTTASWCGPCRRFTPTLVQYYKTFKASSGDHFEFILCSWDETKGAMIKYMEEDGIPWYGNWNRRKSEFWRKYQADGIPCLIIVDRNGYILSNSYVNGEFRGPREVMTDLTKLLAYSSSKSKERLSVPTPGIDMQKLSGAIEDRQWKAQDEDLDLKITLVHNPQSMLDEIVDPNSPETLIRLKIVISKMGVVKSVNLVGYENSRLSEVLSRALLLWQFLPAVQSDGTVQEIEAVLPMRLNLKEEFLASLPGDPSGNLASSRGD